LEREGSEGQERVKGKKGRDNGKGEDRGVKDVIERHIGRE